MNCSFPSSNSRLLPLVSNALLLALAQSIAGSRFFFLNSSSTLCISANCFLSSSDFRDSTPSLGSGRLNAPGDSMSISSPASFMAASWTKAEATENWPSRKRCMAMARLISAGWEDSASYSEVGSGLSLNFY